MPQPSVPVASVSGSTSAASACTSQAGALDGMLGQAVALRRPASARGRGRAVPAWLPEQLLWISSRRPALLRAELEIGLRRLGPREQRAHRGDLLGRVVMGGAGDRELVVRQVVAGAHERQRLQRLRGGAHEARQRRVAGARRPPRRRERRLRERGARASTTPLRRTSTTIGSLTKANHMRSLRMVGFSGMVGICRPLMGTTTRPTKRWSSPTPCSCARWPIRSASS